MNTYWHFWVQLFSRRERATTQAVLRIGVAAVVIYSLLSIAGADLVSALWVHRDFGGIHPHGSGNHLLSALGGPTPTAVWGLWGVSLVGALAMLFGLGGRWVILVVQQCYVALFTINGNATGGYDLLLSNAMWLLFLGSCTRTLSLDCRMRRGEWRSDEEVLAWPRYLLVFQLLLMYFWTGVQKTAASWTPFGGYSALYYVFNDPTWLRFDVADYAVSLYPITQILTAVTWHWEQLAPIAMLFYFYFDYTKDRAGRLRRGFTRWDLRLPFVSVGLGLHLSILLIMNVGPFSWISLVYYLALLRPVEVAAGFRKVSAITQRWRSHNPATTLLSRSGLGDIGCGGPRT